MRHDPWGIRFKKALIMSYRKTMWWCGIHRMMIIHRIETLYKIWIWMGESLWMMVSSLWIRITNVFMCCLDGMQIIWSKKMRCVTMIITMACRYCLLARRDVHWSLLDLQSRYVLSRPLYTQSVSMLRLWPLSFATRSISSPGVSVDKILNTV